jgi:hypothetical protein
MSNKLKSSWASPEAIHNPTSNDPYFDKSKNLSTCSLVKGEALEIALENATKEKKAKIRKAGFQTKSGKRFFPSKDSSVPTSAKTEFFGTLKNEITGKEIEVSRKTPLEERLETAEKMTAYCIKRVQYRKQGGTFLLSETDKDDARAAGLHACVKFGFFEHGKTEGLFKAIMRGIRGRDCLDLGRKKGKLRLSNQIEKVSDSQEIFAPDIENVKNRLRKSQVKKIRETMRVLRDSRTADTSRKAISNFKIQRDFFLLTLSLITGKMPRTATPNAYEKRKAVFVEYMKRGRENPSIPRVKIKLNEIENALSENALS